MIRTTAAEKREIIRLVEESELSAKQTLEELDIPRSTFYRWYARYQVAGMLGLEDEPTAPISSGTGSQRVCGIGWFTWP